MLFVYPNTLVEDYATVTDVRRHAGPPRKLQIVHEHNVLTNDILTS